jgi:ABC-2 type transport system permease protein
MNLYAFEVKSNLKYTLIWSLALSALAIGFLFMYPSFSGDIDTAKNILQKLPNAVKQALNVNLDTFFSLAGFYSYIFNFILLAGSVMSLNLSLKIFSQESSTKTADFLFVRPISRSKIFLLKLLAGLSLLLIFHAIFAFIIFWAIVILKDSSVSLLVFALINFSLFIVQLVFFSLGSLVGSFVSKIKSTISIAMPVAFAFFVITALDSAIKNIKLSEFSPLSFFNRNYIIENTSLDTKYVLISVLLIFIFTLIGHKLFVSKDLKN